MEPKKSFTNITFEELSASSNFLNLIVNNVASCILLLDKEMHLHAYNDAIKTMFTNKDDDQLQMQKCGDAIGCAYTIDEITECGTTTHCNKCELRLAAIKSYTDKTPVYQEKISREFYNNNNQKILKHLRFSTRSFYHNKDYYIIMIIDDITEFINLLEKTKKS